MKDYNELVRKSIRKDFAKANFKRNGRAPRVPHLKNTKRVVEITKASGYYEHRKFILGKIVRILRPGVVGGVWIEFVRDADRDALNKAAGWKDKREYLLLGAKFDD